LRGGVKLLFQPAEEGLGGARAMIADGALENPPLTAVFAGHVFPLLQTGRIGYCRGAAQASVDNFFITVTGRGGHAAHPESALDPLAPAARLVGAVKEKAAGFDKALVAVSAFQAGTATNIIPETAALSGTIRAHDPDQRRRARRAVAEAAAETEKQTGAAARVRLEESYPMLINDDAMIDRLLEVGREVLGEEGLVEMPPSYGAEDMAYFLDRVPGVNYFLGCGRPGDDQPAMLHSPAFDPDEDCLAVGVEIMLRLAERILSRSAQ
jgi:amidohydrolase